MTVLQAMRAPGCALSVWAMAGAAWAQGDAGAEALSQQQLDILIGMGGLVTLMLLVGAALIWNLQMQTRELARDHPELLERYAALPFGVPEGTVRGLVSVMIIIVGLGVLIVQDPLGIESTEAVAGFISAVIAFYFVTREQAVTRGALEGSAAALRAATHDVRAAASDVKNTSVLGHVRAMSAPSGDWRWLADVVEPAVYEELQRQQHDVDLALPLRGEINRLSDEQLAAVVARSAPMLSPEQWFSVAYRSASQNADELSAEIALEIERTHANRTPAAKVTRDLVRAWVQESFKATLVQLRRLKPEDEINLNAPIGDDGYSLSVNALTKTIGRGVRYVQGKIDPTPKDIDLRIGARPMAEAAKGTIGVLIQTLTGKIWPLVNPNKSEGAGP